ncbi:MAG: tRNA lysidine(34) synthetase TilS [Eubacterium sp.]
MNNKALKTVEKYNMLSVGDTVVAAVSGGADSMAMLNFLLSVKQQYNLRIIVAHMEHGIRGEEAKADAEFVKDYCKKNNVDFKIKHINAPKEARSASMGVEEYSRKKRYEFFYSIPCDKIATAHNLSDNAETVLFRLIRGTGLKGMCGIPPVRDKIIRPFIEISSEEIRSFCRENNIEYRNDSTNACNDYSRNIIRNEILPLAKKINYSCEGSICSFVGDASEDYGFIEASANAAFLNCIEDNQLNLEKLREYDRAVIKRVIIKYFISNGLNIDKVHLENVLEAVYNPQKTQIRGSIYAVSSKSFLHIADFGRCNDSINFFKEILNINEFIPKDIDFYCDCDKIIGNVTVRCRQSGDCIKPVGRGCTKSLKKLFNELSVPVEKRNSVGVVCDDLGVIGVIGICADERVKVDASTVKILSIKLPSED